MHDFDSYMLYEIKKQNVYSVRIRVILSSSVDGNVLKTAAEKAFRRFPYYARTAVVNDQGAYELIPCEKPVTTAPDDHIVRLGTPETNGLFFAVTYEGSPNSVLSAILFRMFTRLFPDESKFAVNIACNYRADVGCPETYRDMIRMIHVPYLSNMKDWPIEKLSTVTRSRMYIQMQPEVSWEACRKVNAFRREIDAQPDLNSRVDYAVAHSPLLHGIPSAGSISYVGRVEWDGLAPFIEGIYTLSFGHAMIEVNATEENFCLSFQTIAQHEKYIREFLNIMDEEHLPYTVGPFTDRKLPQIILPPAEA